jgi:endo-1,4-beta-xylanase
MNMPIASFASRAAAAAGAVLLIVGCAGEDPGMSGSAGSSGIAGEGGSGGTGGASSQGGSTQTGGSTGTGGGSGQAGSIPTGGVGGQGNTAGQGNPVGQAGAGGQNTAGAGGAAGRGGAGGAGGAAGRGGAAGGTAGRGGAGGAIGGRGGAAGTGVAGTTGGGGGARGPYTLEFVGNITTGNAVDTDGKTFSRHWDQITPENAGKWGSVQANAGGAFNWATLDAIYDYAQRNDIIFKEHAFVWGSQQPGGTIGETQVKSWMTEFCRRYPDTKMIDVVNEPPPHTTPAYANSIGGGTEGTWQWITNSFIWARQACPNAVLILNDYSNIEYTNETTHFLNIVRTIKAAGAPVDALGAQCHALDLAQVNLPVVQANLIRMYNEGQLPIYVTEMDLSTTDDNQQLLWYQQYFPLFRDSGYVKGLTIWGWIYGKTWSLAPDSGLVRNGTPRPAMTWLMQQLGRPNP